MPILIYLCKRKYKERGKKGCLVLFIIVGTHDVFKPTDIWPPLNCIFVLMPKSHE